MGKIIDGIKRNLALEQGCERALVWAVGRARHLEDPDAMLVDCDQIRERTPNLNANPHYVSPETYRVSV